VLRGAGLHRAVAASRAFPTSTWSTCRTPGATSCAAPSWCSTTRSARGALGARAHEHGAAQLQGRKFVEFENLFDVTRVPPVLIVTFIAMLELAKETLIELTQAEAFAPIYVRLAYQPT
jgi:hypothetical protein